MYNYNPFFIPIKTIKREYLHIYEVGQIRIQFYIKLLFLKQDN